MARIKISKTSSAPRKPQKRLTAEEKVARAREALLKAEEALAIHQMRDVILDPSKAGMSAAIDAVTVAIEMNKPTPALKVVEGVINAVLGTDYRIIKRRKTK